MSLDTRRVALSLVLIVVLLVEILACLQETRLTMLALLSIAQEFTLSRPPTTGPVVRPPATEAAHDGEVERRAV